MSDYTELIREAVRIAYEDGDIEDAYADFSDLAIFLKEKLKEHDQQTRDEVAKMTEEMQNDSDGYYFGDEPITNWDRGWKTACREIASNIRNMKGGKAG